MAEGTPLVSETEYPRHGPAQHLPATSGGIISFVEQSLDQDMQVPSLIFVFLSAFPHDHTIISLSVMGWIRGDMYTHQSPLQKGANSTVEDTPPLGPVINLDAHLPTSVCGGSRSCYIPVNLYIATISPPRRAGPPTPSRDTRQGILLSLISKRLW